ncbi:hypothetical protein OG802_13735 [Streptomyces sp. NBC_00704]|uniref:hypothetical protein n=1 Tax=Streptomyces sp. NBC_00704 TaxID=2975809 RepID=UPI002E305B7D|nr:hypothetical protein [Streptomyces sp. NBC_00704]
MSKRQVRSMLRSVAGGGPVELTSPMASVKKLARLACVAQQFGYEYVDVRHGGSRNSALKMLIVPDPSPQARARAAQNWARYPNAHDGVSVPPPAPDAFALLKTRITFDLTGRSAERRMGYGVLGGTAGCAILGLRLGGTSDDFVVSFVVWVALMAVCGIGFVVNRRRHAGAAARLRAAGFVAVTDADGQARYLTPAMAASQGQNPYGTGLPSQAPATHAPAGPPGPYAQPAPAPYVQAAPGPYAQPGLDPYAQPAPAPYAQAAPGPYAQPGLDPYAQPAPGPYAQPGPDPYPQPGPYAQPTPYAQPQPGPYGQHPYPQQHAQPPAQQPYGQVRPQPQAHPQQPPPAPYPPRPPHPYGQPPQG